MRRCRAGSAADLITFAAAVSNGSIDLGGGSDTLTFGDFTNTATGTVEVKAGGALTIDQTSTVINDAAASITVTVACTA